MGRGPNVAGRPGGGPLGFLRRDRLMSIGPGRARGGVPRAVRGSRVALVFEGAAVSESRDNVERLRRAYRLWDETRGGSVGAWMELMAEDVEIRSLGGDQAAPEFGKGRRGKPEAG